VTPMAKKAYVSRQEQYIDFAIGFGGWYLLNGLAWLLIGYDRYGWLGSDYGIPNLFLFPLNVILLIVFLIFRRWIGLGTLGALAINLLIALVMSIVVNGVCAVPFWVSP
jgi:hypothetical protein